MTMTCNICCDQSKSLIGCYICNSEACAQCHQTFLLSTLSEPRCMFCMKMWSREFVMKEFSYKFKKEFFAHIGQVLLEKEKDLLPGAMHEAATLKKINILRENIRDLPTLEKLKRHYRGHDLLVEQSNQRNQRYRLLTMIEDYKKDTVTYGGKYGTMTMSKNTDIVSYKCHQGDCRGFVTSSQHKCGICETVYCSECRCVHEGRCDKDILLNVKTIQAETRACPKCFVPIFKIGGCDQMFCTECKALFSHKTGLLENGSAHNPHFYEWLASRADTSTRIDIENIACGELPQLFIFNDILKDNKINPLGHLQIYRMIIHLREVVLPMFQEDVVRDNFDLRVAYLTGDFNEERWAMKLLNRERKRMRVRAYRELIDTSIIIMTDMIRQLLYEPTQKKSKALVLQYPEFSNMFENSVYDVAELYGGIVPQVLDGCRIY